MYKRALVFAITLAKPIVEHAVFPLMGFLCIIHLVLCSNPGHCFVNHFPGSNINIAIIIIIYGYNTQNDVRQPFCFDSFGTNKVT